MGKKCAIGTDPVTRNRFIKEIKKGTKIADIAEIFDVSVGTVENYRRKYGLIGKSGSKPWAWYTVYLAKNDTPLCCGTATECAKAMNMTLTTFASTVSRVSRGVLKKYDVVIEDMRKEKLGNDDKTHG